MEPIERLHRGEALTEYEQGWLVLIAATLVTREARRNEGRRAKPAAGGGQASTAKPRGGRQPIDVPPSAAAVVSLPPSRRAAKLPYEVAEYSGTEDDAYFARARWLERRQDAGDTLTPAEARWLEVEDRGLVRDPDAYGEIARAPRRQGGRLSFPPSSARFPPDPVSH